MCPVIDLTLSSDEEDQSPNKAARNALEGFLPRKQKFVPTTPAQRHAVEGGGARWSTAGHGNGIEAGWTNGQKAGLQSDHAARRGSEAASHPGTKSNGVNGEAAEEEHTRQAGLQPGIGKTCETPRAPSLNGQQPNGLHTPTTATANGVSQRQHTSEHIAVQDHGRTGKDPNTAPVLAQSHVATLDVASGLDEDQEVVLVGYNSPAQEEWEARRHTPPPPKRQKVNYRFSNGLSTHSALNSGRQPANSVTVFRAVPPIAHAQSGAAPVSGIATTSRVSSAGPGAPYSAEESEMLRRFKQDENMSWDEIVKRFPGRTKGSLSTHYITKARHGAAGSRPAIPMAASTARRTSAASAPAERANESASTNGPVVSRSRLSDWTAHSGRQDHSSPASALLQSTAQQRRPATPLTSQQPQRAQSHATRSQRPSQTGSNQNGTPTSGRRNEYTAEDAALVKQLKEFDKLSWDEIMSYFPARSKGSLQVFYSTKVKNKVLPPPPPGFVAARLASSVPAQPSTAPARAPPVLARTATESLGPEEMVNLRPKRARRDARQDGMVSWADAMTSGRLVEPDEGVAKAEALTSQSPEAEIRAAGPLVEQDRIYCSTPSQILRRREIGTGGRYVSSSAKGVPDELKNHVLDDFNLHKHYERTCGDVTSIAWSPNGTTFAAGSIAISDGRNMQYNSGLNLLVGNSAASVLQELSEHHIPRPLIEDAGNVNALHSMRESQDPRLFLTVAAVAFSPDGSRLYSAGSDKKVRIYSTSDEVRESKCQYAIDHSATVDLLSVSNNGLLATACHSSDGSVQVFDCGSTDYSLRLSLSPSKGYQQAPLFPSALRWGTAKVHSGFLLAGFSSEGDDGEWGPSGETVLCNVETGQRLGLNTATRNVFDLAWNPSPSPGATTFAVASTPSGPKSYRRTTVQCYAPEQNGARQVLELDCPACDINDLVYSPFDDRIIAAGATDGRVYVWDMRYAKSDQSPLHTLKHGNSLNVLDPDRDRELVDTGVRFLSWGATGSRLYSGSSDGVVKVWNPYRSTGNALVKDAATFKTAIMSGAFNHDHRELLIGEECGRLNLLTVGLDDEDGVVKPSSASTLHRAPEPNTDGSPFVRARELLHTEQIVLRPMGDLPIRQAVQGPKYNGPYHKPSEEDWTQAQVNLNEALNAQNDAHSSMELESSQDSPRETKIREADLRVHNAQSTYERLQTRQDESSLLQHAAEATQRDFALREKKRLQLEATELTEACKLPCNFLPPYADGVVPDSGRSEQRIPHAIQSPRLRSIEVHEMNCKELFESGLAAICEPCAKKKTANPRMAGHLDIMCRQRCARIRASFKGTCVECSTPIRDERGGGMCEACNFSCFRCSTRVQTVGLDDGVELYCPVCHASWMPGVLGYDPVSDASEKLKGLVLATQKDEETGLYEGEDTEIMHYLSKWETGKE
jgi:WD40 repeat protein